MSLAKQSCLSPEVSKRTRKLRAGRATEPAKEPSKLRCRACKTIIADESEVFAISAGAPLFVNRFGFLYELITVRTAENLTYYGAKTLHDTWFPGYSW